MQLANELTCVAKIVNVFGSKELLRRKHCATGCLVVVNGQQSNFTFDHSKLHAQSICPKGILQITVKISVLHHLKLLVVVRLGNLQVGEPPLEPLADFELAVVRKLLHVRGIINGQLHLACRNLPTQTGLLDFSCVVAHLHTGQVALICIRRPNV